MDCVFAGYYICNGRACGCGLLGRFGLGLGGRHRDCDGIGSLAGMLRTYRTVHLPDLLRRLDQVYYFRWSIRGRFAQVPSMYNSSGYLGYFRAKLAPLRNNSNPCKDSA